MEENISLDTIRKLTAAEGYLQLDMPRHALQELEAIADVGPLEAPLQFLKGEAFKAQKRYGEAIEPLRRAALLIPAPHNREVWRSLSECFRCGGHQKLADVAQALANAPQSSTIPPILNISITFETPADETEMPDE